MSPSIAPDPVERGLVWSPGEGQELGRGRISGEGGQFQLHGSRVQEPKPGHWQGEHSFPNPLPQASSAHPLKGTAPPLPPQDTPAGSVGAGEAREVPGGGTGGRVFDTARGIYFTAATQRQGPGQPRKHNMRGGCGEERGGQLIYKGVCCFLLVFFFLFFPTFISAICPVEDHAAAH